MSVKSRTSLTLSPEALEIAKQRSRSLGYDSVSEYIQFLILEDERQKRRHIVTRDAAGVTYEASLEKMATHEVIESLMPQPGTKTADHIEAMERGRVPVNFELLKALLGDAFDAGAQAALLNETGVSYAPRSGSGGKDD
jgi:hypothetical protein